MLLDQLIICRPIGMKLSRWLVLNFSRLLGRLLSLLGAYVFYFLQFPALLFRRQKLASHLLSLCARQFLNCLGIRVKVRSDFDWNVSGEGYVHIYNHESPLDVFVIQGYLKLPSITTAGSHLGLILPFFDIAARNAGHVLLDHMSSDSRRKSFSMSFDVMSDYGQMIIAPNGSLVTSIYQRASRSAQVLAKRFSTSIAPWIFAYDGLGLSREDMYNPLSIFLKRIIAPPACITCTLCQRDLDAIPVDLPKDLFEPAVIEFYELRRKQC